MTSARSIPRRRLLVAAAQAIQPALDLGVFFNAVAPKGSTREGALRQLSAAWRNSYAPLLVELASLTRSEEMRGVRQHLLDFVGRQTGQGFAYDVARWQRWMWTQPYDPHPEYAQFKGHLYANIDPRMRDFFPPDRPAASRIRLDQVQWGGVQVNGIPPLVNPVMTSTPGYLKDSHVVFGVMVNGDARAYPKRILAWHEMARDTVGGVPLTIVYCTLCGTVIPYRSGPHTFGTSGLLYESSKLMFDEETKSLWSTLQGQPVIGPLANSGRQLEFETVVTTTWGEWRTEHPRTRVLSLETGHKRDYSEGTAYRDYFGTQELMFEVSRRDSRLKNKDEVLVVRLAGKRPLAVAGPYLRQNREFERVHEGVAIRIVTTAAGASRAWADGKPLAVHRAFWFGWVTQFPDTVLVQ